MFIRPPVPQPLANSTAKVALVLRQAGGARVIEIGGKTVTALIILICLLFAWFIAAASYVAFRDDVVRAIATSERRSVQAYEDRIAELRQRIDKLTARQVANQDTIEDRVASLVARQADLEARQVMVSDLGQRAREAGLAGSGGLAAFEASEAGEISMTSATGATNVPSPASAFAPVAPRGKPTPLDGIPPLAATPREAPAPEPRGFNELKMRGAIQSMVDEVERRTDRMERSQIELLREVAMRAEGTASRQRRIIAATGLPPSRFGLREQVATAPAVPPALALRDVSTQENAMGGPLLPPRAPSLAEIFEQNLSAAERNMRLASETRRVIRALPLARPLSNQHDITSTFGTRLDPFTRGLAMHSGIDFRAPTGTNVRVTAAGRVIEAGTNGGYGRMVEVDHGHGISTRYAHLSAILVKEGDMVPKGAVIGQVGSTGRSTGPHLHYEVRIDDEAHDPLRFVRAKER